MAIKDYNWGSFFPIRGNTGFGKYGVEGSPVLWVQVTGSPILWKFHPNAPSTVPMDS
jgi:hypothetical protein